VRYILLLAACLTLSAMATMARSQTEAQSKSGTQKAKITSQPEPEGASRDSSATENFEVVLRMVLRANGKVSDITVVKGAPDGLSEAAIKAAKNIKFTPAMKDGRRVSQWVTITYHFRMNKD